MRNSSKFLWFTVFLALTVLGSGLALRPQEQKGEDRTAPIVKSQDASSTQLIPDWVKEVRRLRSVGNAETARQILRQNSPAEVYAGDSGPLTPADRPQVFEESAGKTPDGLLQWQDNDIPVFSSSEIESRPDLAVKLDTSTADIYAVAERHSSSSSTGFDDLVLRASSDNGQTWGATKTISHTANDYRWPRISQIGASHLGVVFEEYAYPQFYANVMKVNAANFDDDSVWRLDSDAARTEFRPAITSDIADYPTAPYTYVAYISQGSSPWNTTAIYLKRSEDGEQTWTSRIEISKYSYWCPDMTVALAVKNDVLYCAYTYGDPSSFLGYNVLVKTSYDYGNSWSPGSPIANTPDPERFPRIAAADADHAVCVYQRDGSPGGAYYAYTQDGGASWITDILLATTVEPTSCPEVKATVPSAFFYVSYFDTYTETVHLKRAPYADPNASAWTYRGNAKTTANALPGDQTPALVAKIHPNGGFGGALAWRSGGAGDDVYFDAEWMPAYSLNLSKSGAGTGKVRVEGKLLTLPVTGNYFSGAEVDLEAVPDAGSSFDGWGGDFFSKLNPATITMNSDKSVSAGFVVSGVSVTVTTSPAGRSIAVDGTTYTAPQTFNWTIGSSHTIAVSSPQTGAAGTRYVFSSWSDGGAQSHTITAPSSSTTYTAAFATEYQLSVAVSPAAGGSVALNPASASGWYAVGAGVQMTANPAAGYAFVGWTGSRDQLCQSSNGLYVGA
jgi:hypothetical protein